MSDCFLKKRQVDELWVDGPLNTFAARVAFLIPMILFAVGVIAGTFFGVKYTFNELLIGVGVLLFTASWLPFAFQKPKGSHR
ncbi:hypothetical protein [Marinobacter sp.]|uniref:hypothetical protein n=1 Tax=Marinobacter sp. TaxID=50741 RepID=UPI003A8CF934